jgi:5-formyltetrahydrofolate cyclo-ligase
MDERKRALRAEMKRVRAGLAPIDGDVADLLARAVGDAEPVAGYWPIRDEIDPRPALRSLAASGVALALPVVTARDAPLSFRRWWPDAPMTDGAFGVPIPADGARCLPATLIVPLLAFDRDGWRLGYGGGFYDRTIAALRPSGVRAIGFAHAAQEVAAVPREVDDQRLDLVVTNTEIITPDAPPQ